MWGGNQPPWLAKNHRQPSPSTLPPSPHWLLPGGGSWSGCPSPRAALPLAHEGWICTQLSALFHRDNGGSSRSFAGVGHWPEGSAQIPVGTLQREKWDVTIGSPLLTSPSLSHMRSSQPSSGGDSGMKSQSAPEAKPDTSARYLRGHGGGSTSPKTQHLIPSHRSLPHLTRSGGPSPPAQTSAGGCKNTGRRRWRVDVMPRMVQSPAPSPLTSVPWW